MKWRQEDGQLSSDLWMVLFDSALRSSEATLVDYAKKQSIDLKKDNIKHIIDTVEKHVFDFVFYVSHLIYYLSQLTGEWGDAGEYQVRTAFGRVLLGVEVDAPFSYEQTELFDRTIKDNLDRLDISEMSQDQIRSALMNQSKFTVGGKTFESSDIDEINSILRFIGSKHVYFSATSGKLKYFFFAKGKWQHFSGYDVLIMQKEVMRSPNVIMPLAAINGEQFVVLRQEAFLSIIEQKWRPMLGAGSSFYGGDPFWSISSGIKSKVLELYDMKDNDSFDAAKKQFLSDMQETIMYHELGHAVIDTYVLEPEDNAMGKASKIFYENIFSSLLEFFADFAPERQGVSGALFNMCRVAKSDSLRATRMFWTYFSDVWFYDTSDEYMYMYSDLIVLILLRYLKTDLVIDFEKMEADMVFRNERVGAEKLTLFERLYELYTWDVRELISISKNAKYSLTKETKYDRMAMLLKDIITESSRSVDLHSLKYLTTFWRNMVCYVKRLSKSNTLYTDYLDSQKTKILKKMLILSCGRKKAESYGYDHRRYICERLQELGLGSTQSF